MSEVKNVEYEKWRDENNVGKDDQYRGSKWKIIEMKGKGTKKKRRK